MVRKVYSAEEIKMMNDLYGTMTELYVEDEHFAYCIDVLHAGRTGRCTVLTIPMGIKKPNVKEYLENMYGIGLQTAKKFAQTI